MKWIGAILSVLLAACGPTGAPPTPDAQQTALMQQIIGTATALHLTAEANRLAPSTLEPMGGVQISVTPATPLGGTDFEINGPVTVSASAPNLVRVEFVAQATDGTVIAEYADEAGSDGWSWNWSDPPAGWFGKVLVITYYTDGASLISELYVTVTT
jgi:hypothetical protein